MRRRERRDLTRRVDQVEPLIERRLGCPACRATLIRIDSPGRPADDRCANCGRSLLIVRLAPLTRTCASGSSSLAERTFARILAHLA